MTQLNCCEDFKILLSPNEKQNPHLTAYIVHLKIAFKSRVEENISSSNRLTAVAKTKGSTEARILNFIVPNEYQLL
jgi:hypothetical protein